MSTALKINSSSGNIKEKTPAPVMSRHKSDRREKMSSLRVMTLNAAHGRKNGRHQLFQSKASIKSNLNDIAEVFGREKPHLVALQEADGPSIWSGNFCHVGYLAQKSSYAFALRGEHVKGMKVSYGTAMLSSLNVSNPISVRFPAAPPMLHKGFIACTIQWPGSDNIQVDVISVHLDFARKKVRREQVEEIVSSLKGTKKPMIMMGDFNCDWVSKDPSLRILVEKLGLTAYKPESDELYTFPRFKKRFDWVLISTGLEFSKYTVFQDTISDHLGVVTELNFADDYEVRR